MTRERGSAVLQEEVLKKTGCRPEKLLPLSFGIRHMMQLPVSNFQLGGD